MRRNYENVDFVLDFLCAETVIKLTIWRFSRNVRKVIYCRSTRSGFLTKVVLRIVGLQLIQAQFDLNTLFENGVSLAVKRHRLLSLMLCNVELSSLKAVSDRLGVNLEKLTESSRVSSYKAFFYQSEAIVLSNYFNCQALVETILECQVSEWKRASKYRRYFRSQRALPRKSFYLDTSYNHPSLPTTAVRHGILLVFCLVVFVASMLRRKKLGSVPIVIQCLRKSQSLETKSDFFWLTDSFDTSDIGALLRRKTHLFGRLSKVRTFSIGSPLKASPKSLSVVFYNNFARRYLSNIGVLTSLLLLGINDRARRYFIPDCMSSVFLKCFLEEAETKVITSMHSYFNMPLLLAANASDACYVRSTWSNQGIPQPLIKSSADVFFAWGEETIRIYKESGSRGITFVKTGFIDGRLIDKRSQTLKCQSPKRDLTFVFFDNIVGNDLINSREALISCFEMLFSLLDEFENLHIIYKPKSGAGDEVEHLGLGSRSKEYISKGKMSIASGQRGIDNLPIEFKGQADLAIGFPISSAATECAIAGIRAIHLNFTGIRDHTWDVSLEDRIVFHNVHTAYEALRGFILGANETLGLNPKLNWDVNSFSDNKASQRMNYYLCKLLQYGELPISQRVEKANGAYIQRFSDDDGNELIFT